VRFQVFKKGKIVDSFVLSGAYMFGSDGTSLRKVEISFSEGTIHCERASRDTAALALLWDVQGFGRIMLPTTCLPERERPYCLNLEITRARLMQTLSRREDWALFDETVELEEIWQQALDLFVKAVQSSHDLAQASVLADKSLRKAMIFSEKMAITQADTLFKARKSSRGFNRASLGTHVHTPSLDQKMYVDGVAGISDFAVIEINWAQIEKTPEVYDFSEMDRCVDALTAKKMLFMAGPLLHFHKDSLPQWLFEGRPGFEDIRDAAYRFITEVVTRYRRRISRWIVVSGLNAWNYCAFSVEQILEMTRSANMAVKAVHPRGIRVIEVANLWGEYHGILPNSVSPVAYMDMVIQSGVTFDAFALQVRFGRNETGLHVRDMLQVTSLLDYLSLLGKPLYITQVQIPSDSGTGDCDETVAGVWHKAWDRKRQALWLDQFYRIVMSKPMVDAVVYGNVADHSESLIQHSGVLTESFKPKDAYRVLRRFREFIHSK
jgi:hypothetical protein